MSLSFFDQEPDNSDNQEDVSSFLEEEFFQPPVVRSRKDLRNRKRASKVGKTKKRFVFIFVGVLLILAFFPIYSFALPTLYNVTEKVFPSVVDKFEKDYDGPGFGIVEFEVMPGDLGVTIAQNLYEQNVVASARLFSSIYTRQGGSKIQPGRFILRQEMTVQEAFHELMPPDLSGYVTLTVPEGATQEQIFVFLSTHLGIPVEEFYEVASDLSYFSLPSQAKNLDGYLMPLTYNFDPQNITARSVLLQLVNATKQTLKDLDILETSWHEILTVASLLMREAKTQDFATVARIIFNRLNPDRSFGETNGFLQLDSTITYINNTHGKNRVTTTDEERNLDNLYNTYLYPGLPPGPIASVTKAAIQAAYSPDNNNYLYWVTVNLDTGETLFADTFVEHQKNVLKFQNWCAANSNSGC